MNTYKDQRSSIGRQFVCYYFFSGWDCLSLGLHISFFQPNIEIHLPFGFVRVGWVKHWSRREKAPRIQNHVFGLKERYW